MERLEKSSLGINTAIINILQKYNKRIPIDFVAKVIGRRSFEIQNNVAKLVQEGIIERHGEDITIADNNAK